MTRIARRTELLQPAVQSRRVGLLRVAGEHCANVASRQARCISRGPGIKREAQYSTRSQSEGVETRVHGCYCILFSKVSWEWLSTCHDAMSDAVRPRKWLQSSGDDSVGSQALVRYETLEGLMTAVCSSAGPCPCLTGGCTCRSTLTGQR